MESRAQKVLNLCDENAECKRDDGGDAHNDDCDPPVPHLLNLSWEDILFSHVLPYLRWDDLFRLRGTCWEAKDMVDGYFKQLKSADFTAVQCKLNETAFKVVTSNCTNLRKLIVIRAKWITDINLIPIFKKNHSLLHVDLSDCGCLAGICLLSLAVNCKRLSTLILRECNWLNNGAVETLITHLDSLEIVDLSGCYAIGNQQLHPFVLKFSKLKELHLSNLQTVNDTSLLFIARTCGNSLETLDIRGCGNITDRGVKMVAEYCWKIKALYVASANLVTESSLALLRMRGVQIDRERSRELIPYIPFRVQV